MKANGKSGQSDGGALRRHGWVIRAVGAGRLWAVWSIMMVAAAALLRFQFLQGLGMNAPYITFYPAVVIAALYGGLRAGFLTLTLSAAVGIYFWVEPVHTFTVRESVDWLLLVTFLTTTALISFVTEAMHRARARAHAAMECEAAALAQREADERLRFALEQSQMGEWDLDLADHTVLRTLKHDQIFGYESLLPEWTYERFLEHVLPEDRAEVDRRFRAASATQSNWNIECRIRRKDGALRWIWATGGHQRDATGQAQRMAGIVQDITERKRTEESLRRTNRALRMISECNQALMRATNEADLLRAICRITVEHGGYRMAWVGFAEHNEAKSVRPVAQAGFEAGYLDTVNITWADTERGRGPTGAAIRTGQPVIARDMSSDPAYGPWRAAAIQRGYASSATLPLTSGKRAFGALMVYAGEPDVFNAEEVALLTELAGDLAYGITALRTRAEHEQAEATLRASEEEFHSLAEAMPQIVWVTQPDGANIYFNQQWVDYTGLTLEESSGHGWNIPFHPDDKLRASDAWQQATATSGTYALECRLRRADGAYRWWLIRGVPLRDAEGRILKWFGTCTDIEDIKRTEAALRQKAEALRASNDELEQFNRAMIGRELRMIELKQEINELRCSLGEPPRHETEQLPLKEQANG
ncbi:MAG: PAS domain-containing protein [Verrucomicrobia bacterium]|nr:PAS domain-containing protein [Verrucomicrobiota bacterium]